MPARPHTPTLYLHIGRNKAGSMTLRDSFAANAAAWREHGLHYVMFGHDAAAHPEVPFFENHLELVRYFAALDGDSVLVSNEAISCFTPEFSRAMATGLAGVNVRVLLYVRPYRDWAVSSYKFDVRTGISGADFDRYLQALTPRLSFWPMLRVWGETLGWDRVRVRSLDAEQLEGGDLVQDCCAALGMPPPPQPLAPVNAGPDWTATELLRLAIEEDRPFGWDRHGQAVAEALHELHDDAVSALGHAPPAVYATPEQARWLADLYNTDLAALASHAGASQAGTSHAGASQAGASQAGTRLPPDDAGQASPRPFLPSAAHIPTRLLHHIRDQGLAPAFAALHPEAAAFLRSARFAALCEDHNADPTLFKRVSQRVVRATRGSRV